MTRHNVTCAFVLVACLVLLPGCFVPTSLYCNGCKAVPPKPEELAGVWVGFDSDELMFTRLDLRPDFAGFCARVSPADTSLHDYGVDGYLVTKWTMEDWKVVINLKPATTNAEPIYIRGFCYWPSLELEVGGVNTQWKRKLVLYRESRIDSANQETRDLIRDLEKR